MDFLAVCQGLGLALAAGLVIGVVLPPIMPTWGVIAGAAPLGVLASVVGARTARTRTYGPRSHRDPGGRAGGDSQPRGRHGSGPATGRRGRGGARTSPPGVVALVVLAAALLAVLSLVAPPVSLVAAAALAWLWLIRRRRAERKHEGLRVLR